MSQTVVENNGVNAVLAEDALALQTVEAQRAAFLDAMAKLPTSVSLVTTGRDEQRVGLTVSAFSSLSTDPLSLLVCVNKTAGAHQALIDNGVFGVSVLHESQRDFAKLFSQKGVDRFASDEWVQSEDGAPLLSTATVAFDCRLEKAVDGFTHTILIGTVERIISHASDSADCLIWHQRRFRTAADLV